MTERAKQTLEECHSKHSGHYQYEWTNILPLAMMVYQSLIHSVIKHSLAYLLLGFPLSLPIDCIYSTPQNAIYATPFNYMKQKLQETYLLMRECMDVKQERQKPINLL